MAASHLPKKTLMASNQFCFNCPIFKVDTKLAACLVLRDKVWRGEKPEVRQGCQVAMHDSKCPAVHIVWDMMRDGESDPYHSAEPVVGKLDTKLLRKIAPIQVSGRTADHYALSPRERELLMGSNSMATSMPADAPAPKRRKIAQPVEEQVNTPPTDATVAAAQRGDMTAAVNAAA